MVKDVRCADDLKLLAWNSNTLLANFYSSPSDREKKACQADTVEYRLQIDIRKSKSLDITATNLLPPV